MATITQGQAQAEKEPIKKQNSKGKECTNNKSDISHSWKRLNPYFEPVQTKQTPQ